MMKRTERGVVCVESFAEEEESFGPTLKFLSNLLDFSTLNVKTVATRLQLTREIEDWGNRDDWKYPILWMSGHGTKGGFYVNDPTGPGQSRVDLGTLTDIARSGYSWSGYLVHFGACSTLSGYGDATRDFLYNSGLAGVSGYSKDVDWIPSLAFEMLYIRFIQEAMEHSNSKKGIDEAILVECRNRLLDSRMCSGLIDHLGFRMITRADFDLD